MRDNFLLIVKGIVIGLGKIIPGVSGAMLAISLGIYEKGLKILGNLRKELKKNIKFISFIGIGIVIAIILGSNIVLYFLNNFYLPTMLLFIGLILGSLKPLVKKVKKEKITFSSILVSLIMIVVIVGISLIKGNGEQFLFSKTPTMLFGYFMSGLSEAASTVIPGVSGTAVLMMLGYYNVIMNAFGSILDFGNIINNIYVLIPFGLGLIVGIISIAKLMDYLFSHHKIKTHYAIIGFAIASIIILVLQTMSNVYTFWQIIIALILFVIGYFIALSFEK